MKLLGARKLSYRKSHRDRGFTLIELLIVIVIIGLLAGIIAPSWSGFVNRQRLNTAQSQVYQAMQATRSNAARDKLTWQFSLREHNGVVQWAIHPARDGEFIPATVQANSVYWNDLEPGVLIDSSKNDRGKYETSVRKQSDTGPWRVQFNTYGCPVYNPDDECGSTSLQALGRITLKNENGGSLRRCVVISTILGVTRLGENQPKADSTGKYCY